VAGRRKVLYKYRSTDGISWKYVFRCSSNFGLKGAIWHHSVRLTETGYEFLINTPDREGGELFFGVSLDGLFIDFDERPLLTPIKNTFFSREVYRSCLVKGVEKGGDVVYVSGRCTDGEWNIGYVELSVSRSVHRWGRYNVVSLSDSITIPPSSSGVPYQVRIYRSEGILDIKKLSCGVRNFSGVTYRIFGSYVPYSSSTSLSDFSVIEPTSASQTTAMVDLDTPGIILYLENHSESQGKLEVSLNFYK
jgi:hypothetical protein